MYSKKSTFCVFYAPPLAHAQYTSPAHFTCKENGDQQGRLSLPLSLFLLQLKSTKMEFSCEEEIGREEDEELLSVLGASFRAELVEISLKWRYTSCAIKGS